MSDNHPQPDGEQPPQDNAEVIDGAQPQPTEAPDTATQLEAASNEQLREALFGDQPEKGAPATPEPKAEPETKPEPESEKPDPDKEQEEQEEPEPKPKKSDKLRRVSLSALKDEAQKQEVADAMEMVRKGEAEDLFEAMGKIRGVEKQPKAEPEAPEQDAEATPQETPTLEEQREELERQLDEAQDNFETEEIKRLNREIRNIDREITREELRGELEQRDLKKNQQTFAERFEANTDALEEKYPDLAEEDSYFTLLLDKKVEEAQKAKDPALQDPDFINVFAEEIAVQIKAQAKAPSKPTPPPARPKKPVGSNLAPGHSAPVNMTRDQGEYAVKHADLETLGTALFDK